MKTRAARRLATIGAVMTVPLLAAVGPALANTKPDDGQILGPSLGAAGTLLLFVVIPLGAFLVIAGLAVLPSALSKPRYRPGKPWDHDPAWVGEPASGAASTTGSDSSARGGASAEW